MIEHKKYLSTDNLAQALKMNLSTVQRAVKKLYDKKMILRSQENLKGGGYVFRYKMKKKDAAREVVMQIVEKWSKKVESELCNW